MKDLEQQLQCNPTEFCNSFKPLNIQTNLRGNMTLGKVLESSNYQNKVREKLSIIENTYVEELVITLSDQFPNISALRSCLAQRKPIEDVSEADRTILERLFLNQNLF